MTITKLVSKCARGMKEQLLKTSCSDVLSSKKNLKRKLREEGGSHPPTPNHLYVRRLRSSQPH